MAHKTYQLTYRELKNWKIELKGGEEKELIEKMERLLDEMKDKSLLPEIPENLYYLENEDILDFAQLYPTIKGSDEGIFDCPELKELFNSLNIEYFDSQVKHHVEYGDNGEIINADSRIFLPKLRLKHNNKDYYVPAHWENDGEKLAIVYRFSDTCDEDWY